MRRFIAGLIVLGIVTTGLGALAWAEGEGVSVPSGTTEPWTPDTTEPTTVPHPGCDADSPRWAWTGGDVVESSECTLLANGVPAADILTADPRVTGETPPSSDALNTTPDGTSETCAP